MSDWCAPALKAMTLMEYLIKTGSERVSQQCKENMYAVQTLKDFQYVDRDGKDQGVNVREKAKQLVALLRDEDRLREERAHALKTKEKLAQTATGEGCRAPNPGPSRQAPPLFLKPWQPSLRALLLPLLPGQVGRSSDAGSPLPRLSLPVPSPSLWDPRAENCSVHPQMLTESLLRARCASAPRLGPVATDGFARSPAKGYSVPETKRTGLGGGCPGLEVGDGSLKGDRSRQNQGRPAGRGRWALPPSLAGPLPVSSLCSARPSFQMVTPFPFSPPPSFTPRHPWCRLRPA